MEANESYSEFISHGNMDLEILGESYSEPIKKTQELEFYTKVSVIDTASGQPVYKNGTQMSYYFVKENDLPTLKLLVQGIKNDETKLP